MSKSLLRTLALSTVPYVVAIGLAPLATTAPAWAQDAGDYLKNANRLFDKGDLKGAEIELRNAARSAPENADIHLRLGQIYLLQGNYPAAEAEARTARSRLAPEDKTAPILAESLLREAKYTQLFKDVPVGDRPPKVESAVRLAHGLAHLALRQADVAAPLLREAERLDPQGAAPKLGMARLLLLQNSGDAASEKVNAVLAIDPENGQALLLKAELVRQKGDIDEAIKLYSNVVAKDKLNLQARAGRANLLMAKNDMEGAQADIDILLAAAPNMVQANYLQALLLSRKNDYAKAYDVLQKISGQIGDLPGGMLLFGGVQFQLGQYQQAEVTLNKVLARTPDQPQAAKMLALIAERQGTPAKAVERLEPVVKATPNDAGAWALLANAYLALGQSAKASEAMEKATNLVPDNPRFQTELAIARFSNGAKDKALDDLEHVFENPQQGADIAGPALILGDIQAGRTEKAAAAAEEFVKRAPDNIVAQNLLGLVRVTQNDFPAAEKVFKELVSKHPEFTAAERNLAQVYVAEGRHDDASDAYRDLIVRNPKDVQSMRALAGIAVIQKNYRAAADYLKQASDAAPEDPASGLMLGNLYASQKDWKGALASLRELQSRFSNNIDVLDLMARVQIASGDTTAGIATYRRAVDVAPTVAPLLERYAAALRLAKDYSTARGALEKAVKLDPKSNALKEELVDTAYLESGTKAAVAAARKLMPDDPANPLPDMLVANVLERAGKAPEALAHVQEAEKAHPSEALAVRHAVLSGRAGDAAGAEKHLQSWIKAHPADAGAQLALADFYLSAGKYDTALTEFERLNAAKPDNFVVLNNLAWLYQKKGDGKARALAEKAYALAPQSPAIADTLGWILVEQGDAKAGLQYLRPASAQLPQDFNVQYHLAAALNQTGQADAARVLLKQITADDAKYDSKDEAAHLLTQLGTGK